MMTGGMVRYEDALHDAVFCLSGEKTVATHWFWAKARNELFIKAATIANVSEASHGDVDDTYSGLYTDDCGRASSYKRARTV